MTSTKSGRPFRFGDGQVVHSIKRLEISAKEKKIKCCTETVLPDIPA